MMTQPTTLTIVKNWKINFKKHYWNSALWNWLLNYFKKKQTRLRLQHARWELTLILDPIRNMKYLMIMTGFQSHLAILTNWETLQGTLQNMKNSLLDNILELLTTLHHSLLSAPARVPKCTGKCAHLNRL